MIESEKGSWAESLFFAAFFKKIAGKKLSIYGTVEGTRLIQIVILSPSFSDHPDVPAPYSKRFILNGHAPMTDRRGLRSVPTTQAAQAGELEDFELVRQFKYDQDAQAFEQLFRRHQQYVSHLCLSLLRSRAEAEDALQEIFIKVYRGLNTFEPKVTFRGWLYRITVNHCRDLLDQRARRAEDSEEETLHTLVTFPKQEASVIASMMTEAALDRLKPEYRVAFVLQAVEGHSIAEVAQLLGIGFEAAASRLRRAYQQFIDAYQAINPKD